MNYNYHTHTKRCGHASGEAEEYIVRAIEGGIKYMGFSDHVPVKFEDGTEGKGKMPFCDAEAYIGEIRALAEKYKNKIDILVGFEVEYYAEYFDETLKNTRAWGADYLILGQHYVVPENSKDAVHTFLAKESTEALEEYVSSVISAMETGCFTYIAHPDGYNFTGDDEIYIREIRRLCKKSLELDIPLEINFLGIRDNRHYPRELFWQVAGDVGCPVTFGFDAHNVQSAYDGESYEKAMELVKKYNLNYIGKPKIVPLGVLSV
ncbi:MAG: histidinol-phosphatase [Clostridia bacterium]|nr:histidinol-phosphatase [Clostridia bacterium]